MQNIDYIGIDVSHLTLDVCRQEGGKEISSSMDNSMSAIQSWVSALPATAHCVFEATGIYSRKLEYVLSQQGVRYTKVNPNKIKGYMHACGCLNKSDRHDARYIRRYGEAFKLESGPKVCEDYIQKERYVHALSDLRKTLQNIDNQLHVIKQEPITLDGLLDTYEQIKSSIQAEIIRVEQWLEALQVPCQTNEAELLQTIPGIGHKSAQAMLHAVGTLGCFETDKQLVKYFGLAPVSATSGTSVRKTLGICGTAVPRVRSTLYMAATSAIKSNPACKALHLRLRQKGKPKKVARIAVVNKLVRQAFAVVKSGKPFDHNYEQQYQSAKTENLEN